MVFVNKVAREWLAKHLTGVTSQTSLNQMKRRYYLEYLGANVSAPNSRASLIQLEKMWLAKFVADNLGPAAVFKYRSIEWIDVVIAIGKVPSKYETQNQLIFYLNAP